MTLEDIIVPLSKLTILPGRGHAVLCHVQGEQIEPLQELEFKFKDRHVLGGNRWIVAIVSEAEEPYLDYLNEPLKTAFLYRAMIANDGSVNRYPDIRLPSHLLNQTLAIKGDILYLGGFEVKEEGKNKQSRVNQGEMAGYLDLRLEQPVWHPLPLPVEMQAGKSIDDVLVYDDKLVLVDNIMYPKYLFEYDISDPLQPVFAKTTDLPNNGTYEHIHRGSINSRWMALLSSGVGRAGSSEYVSVFSLPGYEQILSLGLLRAADGFLDKDKFTTLQQELEKARNKVELHDFAVAGDNLLIACGHHGLGIFPLQELLESYFAERDEEQEARLKQLRSRWKSRGRYYNLANLYEDDRHLRRVEGLEEVHQLVQLHNDCVIAVSYGEVYQKLEYKVLYV